MKPDAQPIKVSALLDQAVCMMQSGELSTAIELLLRSRLLVRKSDIGSNILAFMLLEGKSYRKALLWFDQALTLRPFFPEAHAGRGLALHGLERYDEAVQAYGHAVQQRPDDPETLYNRGLALKSLYDHANALQSFLTAIQQRPYYPEANLAAATCLSEMGREHDAIRLLENLLALDPSQAFAWCLKGRLLYEVRSLRDALDSFDTAIVLSPRLFAAHLNKAHVALDLGLLLTAHAALKAALEINPLDADALIFSGNLLKGAGQFELAEAAYRESASMRPVFKNHCPEKRADIRALFILSPMAGNTPYEDLITNADFASYTALLMPGISYDVVELRSKADIIVNLVSDADASGEALALTEDLLDRIGLPVLNPPARVRVTERAHLTRLLGDMEHCVIPQMIRVEGQSILEVGLAVATGLEFPIVVRASGTHGGDRMERVADAADLATFVAVDTKPDYFLSTFVEYQSPDGFFRKYRFIFVDDEILPYHLAIGDVWKVHHATTRMQNCAWMQMEEEAFLSNPWSVFGENGFEALNEIRKKVGLDYFGIDCGLDGEGRVIVFEANASMLVHRRNEEFPYKTPHVERILKAFSQMLLRRKVRTEIW